MAEFLLLWPVLKTLEWLPLPLAALLAAGVAKIARRVTPRWRTVADRNLRLAMPELDASGRAKIIRGVYEQLARVLLFVARMPRIDKSNVDQWMRYEGFENYAQAVRNGRGTLCLTGHLGNWELSAFTHALHGHPMYVMVREFDNPYLDRLLHRYRALTGNQSVRKRDSGRVVLRALRNNEVVGILADQNTAGEDGVFVDFFGVKASATNGLAKVAMRTGATVIPGFALWKPGERCYTLKFYPPLEMVRTGDDEKDLVTNTQRCQTAIEQAIREYPDQWLWIHRRWKTRPPGERPLY